MLMSSSNVYFQLLIALVQYSLRGGVVGTASLARHMGRRRNAAAARSHGGSAPDPGRGGQHTAALGRWHHAQCCDTAMVIAN